MGMGPNVAVLPDLNATFYEAELAAQTEGYISNLILPPLPVDEQYGFFYRMPAESLIQSPRDTRRAPKSAYTEIDGGTEKDTYECVDRGVKGVVDEVLAKNFSKAFDAVEVTRNRCFDALNRDREVRVAAEIFDESNANFTGRKTDISGGTQWSSSSSDPVEDVMTAHGVFRGQCGMKANTIVIGVGLLELLHTNAAIVDRIKYSGGDDPKKITIQMLAGLFGVENLLVGGMVRNSAKQNQITPSATFADIWANDKLLLCRTSATADFETPHYGRTFIYTPEGSDIFGVTEGWYDDDTRSDHVRVRHNIQEKVIYPEAGHILYSIQ